MSVSYTDAVLIVFYHKGAFHKLCQQDFANFWPPLPLCQQVYYISLCSTISLWLTPPPPSPADIVYGGPLTGNFQLFRYVTEVHFISEQNLWKKPHLWNDQWPITPILELSQNLLFLSSKCTFLLNNYGISPKVIYGYFEIYQECPLSWQVRDISPFD